MDPSVAVAPNIFDVVATPDVMLPLVLANAMSPRLWQMAGRVRDADDPLTAAQRVIDRSFTHVRPARVAEVFGTLDLRGERARLGTEVVDRAVGDILGVAGEMRRQQVVDPDTAIEEHLARGIFPAYAYVNLDLVHATRRHQRSATRRPRGMTSCLDEAALFAALLMATPVTDVLDGIVVLGSPAHYTVFGWTGDRGWWFWGKNALFTPESFRDEADGRHGGDVRRAYAARMAVVDRITSRRGSLDLVTGEGSIPAHELDGTLAAIERFFGHLPAGLEGAATRHQPAAPSPFDTVMDQCLGRGSADEVAAVVRAHAAGAGRLADAANLALLSFRALDVPDTTPYLAAARRGALVREWVARIAGPADAEAAVATIAGTEPVMGDATRLALPDEVIAHGTASDAERELLLQVLLEGVDRDRQAPGAPASPR